MSPLDGLIRKTCAAATLASYLNLCGVDGVASLPLELPRNDRLEAAEASPVEARRRIVRPLEVAL